MGEIKQHAFHTSSDLVKPEQTFTPSPPLFRPIPIRPQGAFQSQPPQWLLSSSSPSSPQASSPLSRASTPGDDADYIYLPESSTARERKLAALREALMGGELAPLSKTLLSAVTPVLLTVVTTVLAYSVFLHGIPLPTRVVSLNVDVEEVSDTRWLVLVLLVLFCVRFALGGWEVEDHPIPVSQPGTDRSPHTAYSGHA